MRACFLLAALLISACGVDPHAELTVTPDRLTFDAGNYDHQQEAVRLLASDDSAPIDLYGVDWGDGDREYITIGRVNVMPETLQPGEGFSLLIGFHRGGATVPDGGVWGEVLIDTSAGVFVVEVEAR